MDGIENTITSFIPPVRYFSEVLSKRILPSFVETLGQSEAYDFDYDNGDNDEYCCMEYARQSVINLHAVGLRHLFEQQVCYLVASILQKTRNVKLISKLIKTI